MKLFYDQGFLYIDDGKTLREITRNDNIIEVNIGDDKERETILKWYDDVDVPKKNYGINIEKLNYHTFVSKLWEL